MKIKKIILETDKTVAIDIGLISLKVPVPDYEFFYRLNTQSNRSFSRIDDLIFSDDYTEFSYCRYQTFFEDLQLGVQFTSNKAQFKKLIKSPTELFYDTTSWDYLVKMNKIYDYIITLSEPTEDFSVILPTELFDYTFEQVKIDSCDFIFELIRFYE